jgi:hypothetical protein
MISYTAILSSSYALYVRVSAPSRANLTRTKCLLFPRTLPIQSADPLRHVSLNKRTYRAMHYAALMCYVLFCALQYLYSLLYSLLFHSLIIFIPCNRPPLHTHTSRSGKAITSGTAAERVFFHVLMALVSPTASILSSLESAVQLIHTDYRFILFVSFVHTWL